MKSTDYPPFSIETFVIRHKHTGKEYNLNDLAEAKFKRDLYNPWELFAKLA